MDAERGADGAGAVAHDLEAHAAKRLPAARCGGAGRDAAAIVGDRGRRGVVAECARERGVVTRFGDGLHCALPYRPFPSMRREHHRGLQYNMHNTANEGRGKLEKISRADEVG